MKGLNKGIWLEMGGLKYFLRIVTLLVFTTVDAGIIVSRCLLFLGDIVVWLLSLELFLFVYNLRRPRSFCDSGNYDFGIDPISSAPAEPSGLDVGNVSTRGVFEPGRAEPGRAEPS